MIAALIPMITSMMGSGGGAGLGGMLGGGGGGGGIMGMLGGLMGGGKKGGGGQQQQQQQPKEPSIVEKNLASLLGNINQSAMNTPATQKQNMMGGGPSDPFAALGQALGASLSGNPGMIGT